jgi:hypothetical protein
MPLLVFRIIIIDFSKNISHYHCLLFVALYYSLELLVSVKIFIARYILVFDIVSPQRLGLNNSSSWSWQSFSTIFLTHIEIKIQFFLY